MFYIIANNQVFGAKDTLEEACTIAYYEITRGLGTPDIVFEILKEEESGGGQSNKIWYHFNAHYECVNTATNIVVWTP